MVLIQRKSVEIEQVLNLWNALTLRFRTCIPVHDAGKALYF